MNCYCMECDAVWFAFVEPVRCPECDSEDIETDEEEENESEQSV